MERWVGVVLGGHRVLGVLVASWAKLGSKLTARGPGPSSVTACSGACSESFSHGSGVSLRECTAGLEDLQGPAAPRSEHQ